MSQQALIEKPQSEVATTQPDFLTLAIERGVDADALEKLVALHERLEARKAEQAFNEALQKFQERVPVISKNDSGHNSKFATLDHIAKSIQALLAELGLSYFFSQKESTSTDRMIVVCTICHKRGHSRSSEFPIPIDSTKSMNDCQKMGSTSSYGRRYALIQALGITTADTDDDAYAAGQSQRREMAGEPTQDDVNKIKKQWFAVYQKQHLDKVTAAAEFSQWVSDTTSLSLVDADDANKWTAETLDQCEKAIDKRRSDGFLDA